MLADYLLRIKAWVGERREDVLVAAIIVTVATGSFGLGRLSVVWMPQRPIEVIAPDGSATIEARALQPPVSAGADKGINQAAAISGGAASGGSLVASKSGSAYHLLNCPGAKQIKEENKVYFATEADAKAAGYRPAGNCPGLR
ncbi:MAG: Deoxyribonuclease I [Parcubacteria group bacterium GW2011_GWA1_51_12]|nr:MAG: Deoxyribonuclease I [Parcubacteria group bacterium GW2011_GWA1_51_12]